MLISEPTALVTDWLLAGVAVGLGSRLARVGARTRRRAPQLWSAAFLAGAAAALAGGAVHGFAASLSSIARGALWKVVLAGSGLAAGLILAGAAVAALHGTWRRVLLSGTTGQLAVYLALVSRSDDVRIAVWNGVATILVVLALALGRVRDDSPRFAWLLLALALSAAGLGVQRSRVSVALLNHNDLCHVLQTVALWSFYRAGLRLPDRAPRGVDGTPHDHTGRGDWRPATASSRPG